MGNTCCCCRENVERHNKSTVVTSSSSEELLNDNIQPDQFTSTRTSSPDGVTNETDNKDAKTHDERGLRSLPFTVSQSEKVKDLINDIIATRIADWPLPVGKGVLVPLDPTSEDYGNVQEWFLDGNRKRVRITDVCRVENAYLLCSYFLKKEELYSRYGLVDEEIMFHGTSEANVQNILDWNFDWRMAKQSSKFGRGVYFATNSHYASHYPMGVAQEDKVMIVALVLICNTYKTPMKGNRNNMVVPPQGFDSTVNQNGQLLVKYDDDEFYPAYVIWYKKQNN